MFSSPAGKLLFQFAGYPTAFNNIVMKRFVNESFKYPMSASPKVLGATLAMTSVAVLGNYLRSEGTSFVDYQTGRPKAEGEIIADAWARWGGFAFFDYARRINQNYKYGSGTIGSLAKGVTGPLPADAVDMILYRKGIFSIGASNTPFYGAMGLFDKDAQKAWRTAGRELDKKVEGFIFGEKKSSSNRRMRYRTGGPSVDVPNAPDRPEERVNKNTGMPYDLEAGPTAQPEKDRKGFSEEGKLLATLERRQKKFTGGAENLVEDTVLDMVKDKSWFKRATEPEGELYKGKHTLLTTSMEVDGKEYLFPTIREVNGKLKKLSNQAALEEAMRKKDFLVFEGKDKKERIAKATEVSKIISNLVMPTRDTRMKKNQGTSFLDIIKHNIREEEGKKLTAYKPVPSEEHYTIGYGHYGPDVKEGMTITEEEAEKLLDKDVKLRIKEINRMLPKFNEFPVDVQVPIFSEYYRGSIGGSKNTRRLINEGKYAEAAVEFLNNKEYRDAEKLGKRGIRTRMEKVADALNRLAKLNK